MAKTEGPLEGEPADRGGVGGLPPFYSDGGCGDPGRTRRRPQRRDRSSRHHRQGLRSRRQRIGLQQGQSLFIGDFGMICSIQHFIQQA